ncbi:MAG: sensor histidine kinase [Xanthomonadales bacterium]|nr:sensor histidine kinase [Gammaproteobacteria bacterium]MBT8054911.1 sensor histidine kinase [Gammaproteobacteria bacterium]NND57311.1 sensor histidine kinase [Xanthomonadales bacterium]NNK51045.1 sensor histidine kinase [Xanthomonadales bacterium]
MEFPESKHRPIELLRYAGLFTWICASIPLFLMTYWYEIPLGTNQYLTWWVLHLVFGLTYWNQVKVLPVRSNLSHRLVTVSVLTACALGVSMMAETSLGGILLLIVAGLLPWMLPAAPAMAWLIGQNVLLVLVISRIPDAAFSDAALAGGLFLGISLFAFMSGIVALRQHVARDALRKVNSELLATQALLADNTRIAERVRIARELHDLVGHHLTALTLNLEVATHLADGKALEHVQQAHSLAKLLLADVREVVNDMRVDDKVDLAAALRTLVSGVPEPAIHLNLPSELAMTDPRRAQVLLRCAQEIITNSVRHARAKNLWIDLVQDQDGVALTARDDGRGVNAVERGNGLNGMSERLRQVGGELKIETSPGAGFSLQARIPLEGIA